MRKSGSRAGHLTDKSSHAVVRMSFRRVGGSAFEGAGEGTAEAPMQRVLVCVLCGSERWINPRLSTLLVQMALDARFAVQLEWVYDARPVDYARNLCVSKARSGGFDWLCMIDHGCAPSCSPLDVLATVPSEVSIVGLGAGICVNGVHKWNIETPAKPEVLGKFQEVSRIGAACLMMRSQVWQRIKGPWFRWVTGDDELLSPEGGKGEDVFFCDLARQNGFKIWTHGTSPAGHLRTCDLTEIVMQAGRR